MAPCPKPGPPWSLIVIMPDHPGTLFPRSNGWMNDLSDYDRESYEFCNCKGVTLNIHKNGNLEMLVSDNGTQKHHPNFLPSSWVQNSRILWRKGGGGQTHADAGISQNGQSNGLAERFVDTFKWMLTKLGKKGKVEENLDIFSQTYRSSQIQL